MDERDLEFTRALWARTPVFSYVFLGLNILIVILMEFAGGATNNQTLLAFGAKANELIDQGQSWRFLTPVFIHIGLLHLFLNSYALWMVGPQVEKIYGNARFVLLYLATGVAGVAASYWRNPHILSAGASGAIFGLFGVLLVFGYKYKDSIPGFFRSATGAGVLPVIAINLFIGFTIPGIDNSAHIGGLVTGALLALVVGFERPETTTPPGYKIIQGVLLLAMAVAFSQVISHYDGPRISVRNLWRNLGNVARSAPSPQDEFFGLLRRSEGSYVRSMNALVKWKREDFASAREETVKVIDAWKRAPSITRRADKLGASFQRIMEEQYAALQDAEHANTRTFAMDTRIKEIAEMHDRFLVDFKQWQKDGEK